MPAPVRRRVAPQATRQPRLTLKVRRREVPLAEHGAVEAERAERVAEERVAEERLAAVWPADQREARVPLAAQIFSRC